MKIEAHLTTADGQKVRIIRKGSSFFTSTREATKAIKVLAAEELTAGATKITGHVVDAATGKRRTVAVKAVEVDQ